MPTLCALQIRGPILSPSMCIFLTWTDSKICSQAEGNPRTAHIPVLHISATFVDTEYRVRGLETGADGYLAEPISRDELLATVGALLRLKQAERAARLHAAEAEKARKDLEIACLRSG